MPIHSRWTIPIPSTSLQTFIFHSPTTLLPNTVAFYDAERPETHFLTQESFKIWALRFAAGLRKAGLKTGDRVLLFSGNDLFFPVVFMGILMAGGIFTGANPSYVARELAYQLQDSEAKFLICADGSLELGIEAAKSIGMSKQHIFLYDDKIFENHVDSRLGSRHWSALIESEDVGRKFKWIEPKDAKDTICALNYSSGTTGVPKGVMISHYSYIANCLQVANQATLHPDYEERRKTAKWLCFLPMYHAYAQTLFIVGGPNRNIPVYIMKKFDLAKMLEIVQKYRITQLNMVPPIVVAMAKSPLTKKYDISSVVDIGSGAAPLSGDVVEQYERLWPEGDRKMKQGWGMTEATCSILGWDPNIDSNASSVGELNANCHAKIMAPDNKTEVPIGERGEIWIQAPNIMKGYWRNPSATSEIFVDCSDGQWMRTGDVAYVNAEGCFFVVDRMKELIKVKGNQVAPAELEAVLLEHPMVADAAVVGVVIEGEEVPRAYLVLNDGKKGDERLAREIGEWMAKRVTRYKRLAGGVAFVDAVPKNPSGKILRKILRDRARKEVGDQERVQAKL